MASSLFSPGGRDPSVAVELRFTHAVTTLPVDVGLVPAALRHDSLSSAVTDAREWSRERPELVVHCYLTCTGKRDWLLVKFRRGHQITPLLVG